jgi:uncharacterized membrane protein YfcA
MEIGILFFSVLFIIAFLYASVGHGGASGYLALMGIWGISQITAKPVALTLNCVVSLIAFLSFYKKGFFNWNLFLYLILGSIPFAYLGGTFSISDKYYKIILGILLFFTAIRFFIAQKDNEEIIEPNYYYLMITGAIIGFISGLIGIGGGIILSPFLLLMKWSDIKTTSGISALFIFVNSIAGLFAIFQKGFTYSSEMIIMASIAIIGGVIGSMIGSHFVSNAMLKKVLAFVLIIASIKLILV